MLKPETIAAWIDEVLMAERPGMELRMLLREAALKSASFRRLVEIAHNRQPVYPDQEIADAFAEGVLAGIVIGAKSQGAALREYIP